MKRRVVKKCAQLFYGRPPFCLKPPCMAVIMRLFFTRRSSVAGNPPPFFASAGPLRVGFLFLLSLAVNTSLHRVQHVGADRLHLSLSLSRHRRRT